MATLTFVGTSFVRFEKDEEGELYKRRYFKGDEVETTSAKAKLLLELEVGGRHLFVESQADADEEEANMPRQDVGAGDPRANVPQGTVTNEVKPAAKQVSSK